MEDHAVKCCSTCQREYQEAGRALLEDLTAEENEAVDRDHYQRDSEPDHEENKQMVQRRAHRRARKSRAAAKAAKRSPPKMKRMKKKAPTTGAVKKRHNKRRAMKGKMAMAKY